MSALGELLVFMFYSVLALAAISCLLRSITSKTKWSKFLYFTGFIISSSLFFIYYSYKTNSHRDSELEYVGVYYLTQYENCDSCKVILKEDNTYEVMSGNTIVEKGSWHYESGGDYFIVYMDNDKEQLGSGRFAYERYDNRYKSSNKSENEAN